MTFDTKAFRHALGSFPTGVAVVTAMGAEVSPVKLRLEGAQPAVSVGQLVRVVGLRARLWSKDGGRFGLSFRADELVPMTPAGTSPAFALAHVVVYPVVTIVFSIGLALRPWPSAYLSVG